MSVDSKTKSYWILSKIALLFIFPTLHLQPTHYLCHRFVCSHSSRISRSQEAQTFSLILYYIIYLFWSSPSQNTWQSLKELTFYLLRLMHQTSQRDFSNQWHFTVELFAKRSTKQVREILLLFDTLQLSCLLSKVPNRSGGLFYPLTFL